MCRLSKDAIDAVLGSGRIYEVGGAVRDRYLFKTETDQDRDYLVTGISYDDLIHILSKFGRVDLVGRSFGVIKFTQRLEGAQHTFDIALPRKELSTGAGHRDFSVTFDPDLSVEEDLKRRDFTVNALAVELDSGNLLDPLNGMADLEKRQLRIVYDESFQDDPLRMLRAVQFAARFEFEIEAATFEALRQHAALIKTISPERIAEELNKLMKLAKAPSIGFRLMQSTGLLEHIIPELEACVGVDQPGGYHAYDVFEHSMRIIDACPVGNLRLRMAALFHDINKPQAKRIVENGATFYGHESAGARTARQVLKRLRYSNDFIDEVSLLVDRHMFTSDVSDKGVRRLIRKVGQDLIFDLLDLRRADVIAQGIGGTTEDVDELEKRINEQIAFQPPFGLSDLAVDGRMLMELLNIKPGPKVGRVLDHLMEKVLDDPENNTQEILESFAREFYHNNTDKESEV